MEVKGHNGTVIFDGRSVTIKRTGFFARTSVGKGEKRIPLGSITAVQWKPAGPIVPGFIQFTVPGGKERRSRFGAQSAEAGHDENAVTFYQWHEQAFQQLRDVVEEALHAESPAQHSSSAPGKSPAERLAHLKELHDQGLVSDAEFGAKRSQILDSL